MKTHRLILILAVWCFWNGSVQAQGFVHRFTSFIGKNNVVVPMSEIPYQSVRLRGLSVAFAGLVPDSLTDLFVNPAALFQLSRSRFLLEYAPSPPPQVPIDPIQPQADTLADGQAPSPGTFPGPTPNGTLTEGPVVSLGYWSPALLGNALSGGVFVQGITRKVSSLSNRNQSSTTRKFTMVLQNLSARDELNVQLWLGAVKRPRFQLAASYRFYYLHDKIESQFNQRDDFSDEHVSRETRYDKTGGGGMPWRGHEVMLGARFHASHWQLLPQLRWKYYRSRSNVTTVRTGFEHAVSVDPANPSDFTRQLREVKNLPRLYRLYAWEAGLEGWRQRTRIHLFARIARLKIREALDDSLLSTVSQTGQFPFQESLTFTEHRLVTGSNTEIALRGGLGQVVSLSRHARLLAGLELGYVRNKVSGPQAYLVNSVITRDSVTNQTQVDDELAALDRNRTVSLRVPIALEAGRGPVQVRLGFLWRWQDGDLHSRLLNDPLSQDVQERRSSQRQIERKLNAGLGFHWRHFQINAFLGTDITQLERWQIALTATP